MSTSSATALNIALQRGGSFASGDPVCCIVAEVVGDRRLVPRFRRSQFSGRLVAADVGCVR